MIHVIARNFLVSKDIENVHKLNQEICVAKGS